MPAQSSVSNPWYTLAEVATLFNVTERCIQKWAASGRLPQPVRKGRRWVRWPRVVIDDLIRRWSAGGAP